MAPVGQDGARTDELDTEINDEGTRTATRPREKSARELAMEAIELKADLAFEQEAGVSRRTDEDDDEFAGAGDPDANEDDIAADAARRAIGKAPKTPAAGAGDDYLALDGLRGKKLKLKIDGEEVEMTLEEALANTSRNAAASKRLNDATRLYNEAQVARAQADEATRQAQASTTPQTPAATDTPDATEQEFLSALYEGEHDKAQAAFAGAVAAATNKALRGREQAILDGVTKAALPQLKQQLAVESALESFQKDYADIANNESLAAVADGFIDADVKSGKSLPAAIKEAGDKTRKWVREQAKAIGLTVADDPTPGNKRPTARRQDKLERKSATDDVVRAGSVTASTDNDDQPENIADTINEMKKARGQL
jgi:hypothetical protein